MRYLSVILSAPAWVAILPMRLMCWVFSSDVPFAIALGVLAAHVIVYGV